MLFKKLYQLGDKLEDKVRGKLSHFPIVYAFIGGAGIIIFWRGIWRVTDFIAEYTTRGQNIEHILWDGIISIIFGMVLLLLVGLFVSSFIGNEIIISGIKGEKRISEKTESEIKQDILLDFQIRDEIKNITKRLDNIQKILKNKK